MGKSAGFRGEQLKMFMTAHEITRKYQVLDGDREEKYDRKGQYLGEETDKEVYKRKYQEASYDPEDYHLDVNSQGKRFFRADGRSTDSPGTWKDVTQGDDTYAREGTQQTFVSHQEKYTQSLRDHIADGGDIPPVHLGSQFGSRDKPQIYGGHHRLAVLRKEDPKRLIPVVHHGENFMDAKYSDSKDYKYT